jgi:diguanylate cyclase
MNQPSDDWKKKYFDSLADLERKEKHWETVESALRRCISRISFVGDGLDPSLDERLEHLRNRVRGEKDTRTLLRLVEDIAAKAEGIQGKSDPLDDIASSDKFLGALFSQATFPKTVEKRARKLAKALNQTTVSTDTLQAAKALILDVLSQPATPEADKGKGLIGKLFAKDKEREDERTSARIIASDHSISTPQEERIEGQKLFVSLINQLESSLQQMDQLHLLAEKAASASSNRELECLTTDLVKVLLLTQGADVADRLPPVDQVLLQLIERIDITKQLEPRVQSLKKQLVRGIIAKDIPSILTELLQLVEYAKTQAENERQEVERFLLQMTEQLQQLDQEVAGVSGIGGELIEGNKQLDQEMQIQVDHIQSSVTHATELNELKLSISERLNVIQERLRDNRSDNVRLVENFEHRIDLLTTKIGSMEQETASLKESVQKARTEAFTDALTGLHNRHAFDCKLEEEFARWNRYGFPLSMIIVDVDHFKKVNDTYGHLAGDKVLHVIGAHLKKATRNVDFPARYGGEEFVVLLPEVDLKGAKIVAEKIRQAVEEKPFRSGDNRVNITVSCGVASFRKDDARKTPFERADEALYLAKRGGRNRCCSEDQVKQNIEVN